ncbi:MAG TPA: DUF2304 domain-containing protein [Patescibacteria group bacterium]|nr:DUF2304 domain-containing protein [Patescibacteria group bacterium]
MIVLQALAVIFGVFMMYVVRIHRRKRNLEPFEYGGWLAVWIIFLFLTLFPQTVQGVAQTLQIGSALDFLLILAMMILSFLTLQNRLDNRKIEKKIEDIVREKAINEKTPAHRRHSKL